MSEPASSTSMDPLPGIVRVAVAQGAAHAAGTIAGALGLQFKEPALTPEQATAWKAAVLELAALPLLQAWNSLDTALLPAAGPAAIITVLREVIEQAYIASAAVRQHLPPPAAAEASRVGGSTA